MNYYVVSAAVNLITSLLLLGFVSLKSKGRNKLSNIFCLFAFSIAFWSINYFLWQTSANATSALFYSRLLMLGAIWIPSIFFNLITYLIGAARLERSSIIMYFISAVFSALCFSDLFITDVREIDGFKYWPKPGPIFIWFVIYFLFLTIIAHWMMWFSIRSEKEKKKQLQTKYVFLGTLIGFIGGSTNYFLFYEIPIKPYGNILVSIYVGTVAYAIIKHQLMEIEIVIRRATVFAGLFAFVYCVFSVFTILGQRLFESALGWNSAFSMLPTVFIITFALRPLEEFLTNVTEKYLFQKKYDYKILLRTFTSDVLTVLDLQQLLDKTTEGLCQIIKLESCSIYLWDSSENHFKCRANTIGSSKRIVLTQDDVLVYYLGVSNGYLYKNSFPDKFALQNELKKLNGELCLSIQFNEKLMGIIVLGAKKSGESYSSEDIDILVTLARTEGIAISNAQLFQELSSTQAEAAQKEKMAVVGTLAAGINHEICNPLGIARGQCEMFLLNYRDGIYKDVPEKELVEKCVVIYEKVINEIDRATGITKRLSSFAKPSKKFELGEVKLGHSVSEVLAILGYELRLDNIQVTTAIPESIPAILGDKKQIEEIIFNIVRNAAQAIAGKGNIMINAVEHGNRVTLEIEDTGGGITADKIGQIFNPFYTTKAPGKGTGLGLFIVKQIVERNRGTIAVHSQVGGGTTFALSFEVAKQVVAA